VLDAALMDLNAAAAEEAGNQPAEPAAAAASVAEPAAAEAEAAPVATAVEQPAAPPAPPTTNGWHAAPDGAAATAEAERAVAARDEALAEAAACVPCTAHDSFQAAVISRSLSQTFCRAEAAFSAACAEPSPESGTVSVSAAEADALAPLRRWTAAADGDGVAAALTDAAARVDRAKRCLADMEAKLKVVDDLEKALDCDQEEFKLEFKKFCKFCRCLR
jgi:hypothetical protein